jgi:hypothetical protein
MRVRKTLPPMVRMRMSSGHRAAGTVRASDQASWAWVAAVIIEVFLCEDCGQDARVPRRPQLPACTMCGSTRVSFCERAETPAEISRMVDNLRGKLLHKTA